MPSGKRDFLDDIIDMQSDWQALSHKGDDLVNQLGMNPDEAPVFDPADYKDRPRVSSLYCVSAVSGKPDACTACRDVCPVDAITITGATVRINDSCRKCGLCVAACPTEVFTSNKCAPMTIYDSIARVATAYEQCYISCTRALGRLPRENEILLPCVAAISRETWFNLLCEFPNLSVYLPLGVCDRCRTVTGEKTFSEAIADAEEWSGESVGLEVDEADLTREQKRAYKRSQFVSSMTQAGTRLVSRANPALAGAQAVAKRLQDHSKQITELQQTLEKAVGTQGSRTKRRLLTRKRRLLMAGLQKFPDLADELLLAFPQVDSGRCTMCEDCVKACKVHALELSPEGFVHLEPSYCVNCGACEAVCPEGAISMVEHATQELVVPDKHAEEKALQRAKIERTKKKGKDALERGLSMLEGLADDDN